MIHSLTGSIVIISTMSRRAFVSFMSVQTTSAHYVASKAINRTRNLDIDSKSELYSASAFRVTHVSHVCVVSWMWLTDDGRQVSRAAMW